MRNIKLTIEYDGTNYCGWQRQSNGPSVQETIEKALKKILKQKVNPVRNVKDSASKSKISNGVKLIGAGRTDSGVHARGQVANFKTNSHLTTKEFLFALNAILPKDIAIKDAAEVGLNFNARFYAKSKLYRYDILTGTVPSPLESRYSYQYRSPLNIKLIKKEARTLLGRHNFKSFQASDKRKKSSVSEIKSIMVKKSGKHIYIDIVAKGFLYNMVRNIVGTLIEIGRGKFKENDMKKILKAKNRSLAGPTVPANGLCLIRVNY